MLSFSIFSFVLIASFTSVKASQKNAKDAFSFDSTTTGTAAFNFNNFDLYDIEEFPEEYYSDLPDLLHGPSMTNTIAVTESYGLQTTMEPKTSSTSYVIDSNLPDIAYYPEISTMDQSNDDEIEPSASTSESFTSELSRSNAAHHRSGGRQRALRYGPDKQSKDRFWLDYPYDQMKVILDELTKAWHYSDNRRNRYNVRSRFKYHFNRDTTDILLYGTADQIQNIADDYVVGDVKAPDWFTHLEDHARNLLTQMFRFYYHFPTKVARCEIYNGKSVKRIEDTEYEMVQNDRASLLWRFSDAAKGMNSQRDPEWVTHFSIADRKRLYEPFLQRWKNIDFKICKDEVDRRLSVPLARRILNGDQEAFKIITNASYFG